MKINENIVKASKNRENLPVSFICPSSYKEFVEIPRIKMYFNTMDSPHNLFCEEFRKQRKLLDLTFENVVVNIATCQSIAIDFGSFA